jgi:hypothetical protein
MLNFGAFYVSLNVSNYSEDGIMIGNIIVRIIRSGCAATDKAYLSFHGRPVKSQTG